MRRVLRGAALALVAALVLLPGAGAATARRVAGTQALGTQAFTVDVDGTPKSANLGFDAYFPRATTIHAGDTVKFHWAGVGEPHTTTFGTYTNQAVLAYSKLTPAQQQANAPPKAFAAIDARVPSLLPQGPGDAIQSASNPCY